MKRSWGDFHVEPIEAEEWDEEYPSARYDPHQRAIWRGIDLTTMHNDEVHGIQRKETTDSKATAAVK